MITKSSYESNLFEIIHFSSLNSILYVKEEIHVILSRYETTRLRPTSHTHNFNSIFSRCAVFVVQLYLVSLLL